MEVALLELPGGVALLGGHEARPHLYAVGPQLHDAVDVLARVDAAAGDDRDVAALVCRLKGAHLGHNLRHELLEGVVFVFELFGLVAQVASRLGTLDHNRVGQVAVLREPLAAEQSGGACRRDDGDQLGPRPLGEERGEVERQPRTREDDVGLLGNGRADHVGEVRHGHHDVDADDAARPLARLAQLLLQPPDAGLAVILRIVVVDGSQSGRRDDADASLLGNGRGEARERNADAHAALYDGQRSEQVSDFQCFHGCLARDAFCSVPLRQR